MISLYSKQFDRTTFYLSRIDIVSFRTFLTQIGADGANSMVRKQMNINTLDIKYNQMGLIATVELSEVSHKHICAFISK